MTQKKVLLIHPKDPPFNPYEFPRLCEPLGLEYLAAVSIMDGHETRILDLRTGADNLIDEIISFSPDCVGVTGYSLHVIQAQAVCATVKKILPDCRVVVGGHHATVEPVDFFLPTVDYVVMGEGVWQFKELLLRDFPPLEECADLAGVWVNNEGHFKLSAEGVPLIYDIERLPSPVRTLNPDDRQHYRMGTIKPVALFSTSEGCAFRCNFCSLWRQLDGKYHIRSDERVMSELDEIKEENIFLTDDEPYTNEKRMTRLAKMIIASGIRKNFLSYCRADTMVNRPELMALWREAGLTTISMGVEAITKSELDKHNKKYGPFEVFEAFAVARDLGIKIVPLFIIGLDYGPKDFKQLARFVARNNIDEAVFSILTPLPGSEIFPDLDAITEKQENGRPDWKLFDLQHPVMPTRMPHDDFMEAYFSLWLSLGNGSSLRNDHLTKTGII